MYEEFYGFTEKPFSLRPDPTFLYLSQRHREALSMLEYGLTGQAGFVVISGEIGSGKTTVLRHFINNAGTDSTIGLINNTQFDPGELMRWVSMAFDLDYRGKEQVELYDQFVDFLIHEYGAGRRVVLIVDEAQNMDFDSLEELRMLSNINAEKDQLLQIMLIGQPELLEKLKEPRMSQFAQRVSVDYHLQPLDFRDTRSYVRHRLRRAGGDRALFDKMAIAAIHHFSNGVPRLINTIADTALVYGFAEEKPRIDVHTILGVIEDRKDGVLREFAERLGKIDLNELKRWAGEAAEEGELESASPAAAQPGADIIELKTGSAPPPPPARADREPLLLAPLEDMPAQIRAEEPAVPVSRRPRPGAYEDEPKPARRRPWWQRLV